MDRTTNDPEGESDGWLTGEVLAEIEQAAKGPFTTFASLAEFKAAIARDDSDHTQRQRDVVDATEYLLASPENARRLDAAIRRIEAGEGELHGLSELSSFPDLEQPDSAI